MISCDSLPDIHWFYYCCIVIHRRGDTSPHLLLFYRISRVYRRVSPLLWTITSSCVSAWRRGEIKGDSIVMGDWICEFVNLWICEFVKTAVFDFSSRIVKMLYRQFQRSLFRSSVAGSIWTVRVYCIIFIFYKIKYIFSEYRNRARARMRENPEFTNSQIHKFTNSHQRTLTPHFNISAVWTFFFNMDLTVKVPPAVSQP